MHIIGIDMPSYIQEKARRINKDRGKEHSLITEAIGKVSARI